MEFEVREDAMAAQENMHNGELFGKVLSVNLARARNIDKNRAGTIFSSFTICYERLDQDLHPFARMPVHSVGVESGRVL